MFPPQSETGWVKIDRKIVLWEYFNDPIVRDMFTNFFIRLASHKPFEYKGEKYSRGSFISSVSELSVLSGYTVKQVRRVIKILEKTQSVASKRANKKSAFKVLKYAKYQDGKKEEGQAKGQRKGNERANKPTDTIYKEEYKNNNTLSINACAHAREEETIGGLGEYGNVYLTAEDIEELKSIDKIKWMDYVFRLSEYIATTGKVYDNHCAVIKKWMREDGYI